MKRYFDKIVPLIVVALLVVVIVIASRQSADFVPTTKNGNAALENIFARKSVRSYTNQKVTREQLDTLARAAMAAPTGMGKEPWFIVLIDSRAILDSLAAALPTAKPLMQATAAVAVCCDTTKAAMDVHEHYWVQDCSAASENVLLAAEAMGLGAVWTSVWPRADRLDAAHRILELPDNIIPLNIIAVGYPLHDEKPKNKYKAEKIRWNNFQKK